MVKVPGPKVSDPSFVTVPEKLYVADELNVTEPPDTVIDPKLYVPPGVQATVQFAEYAGPVAVHPAGIAGGFCV